MEQPSTYKDDRCRGHQQRLVSQLGPRPRVPAGIWADEQMRKRSDSDKVGTRFRVSCWFYGREQQRD